MADTDVDARWCTAPVTDRRPVAARRRPPRGVQTWLMAAAGARHAAESSS